MVSFSSASIVALTLVLRPDAALTVVLDISALTALPPHTRRSLTRETDAIWAPHGILVRWISTSAEPAPIGGLPTLRVVDGSCVPEQPCPPGPASGSRSPRLGAVVFLENHVAAENTLVLAVDAIERLVDRTPWGTRRVADWPPAARAELVGRALGRVLAHEMGHYLLAWRAHTQEGLMRTAFRADSLIEPGRESFGLPRLLLPRLNARLAQLSARGARLAKVD